MSDHTSPPSHTLLPLMSAVDNPRFLEIAAPIPIIIANEVTINFPFLDL
jgi:hypothetical protein